jgi:putative ABC transport system ATP-binding protein
MSKVVELREVVKEFRQSATTVSALNGVSLEVERATFVAIVGPSGSGKSTLLNMLGALDRPTRGTVWIDGIDLNNVSEAELTRHRSQKVGFVFQQFNLIPNLTALENVMLPMEFAGQDIKKARARGEQLLGQVGMGHRIHHQPAKLSGGEQQRVAIARALANDAPVILADEPTGNLDSATGKEIIQLFRRLVSESGKTVIVITHDISIGELADQVIRLQDGKVAEGLAAAADAERPPLRSGREESAATR